MDSFNFELQSFYQVHILQYMFLNFAFFYIFFLHNCWSKMEDFTTGISDIMSKWWRVARWAWICRWRWFHNWTSRFDSTNSKMANVPSPWYFQWCALRMLYGRKGTLTNDSEEERMQQRLEFWERKLLKHPKLKTRIRKGIPGEFRSEVWVHITGVSINFETLNMLKVRRARFG